MTLLSNDKLYGVIPATVYVSYSRGKPPLWIIRTRKPHLYARLRRDREFIIRWEMRQFYS